MLRSGISTDLKMVTTEERVTLVLGEDRIEAVRDHLASKSEYFAALFSSKFNDGLKKEHRINYDIETKTLQTFVNWTSDYSVDSISTDFDWRHVKFSLAGLVSTSADVKDVIQLLQLSVLFIAETLVKELTDLIAYRWLDAVNSLRFWSIAKELNLVTLRDLAKAVCIDRIYEFPQDLLLELPAEEFVELLTNSHNRLENDFLDNIVSQWNERNAVNRQCRLEITYDFDQSKDQVSFRNEYSENLFESSIQCVVGHKKTKDDKLKACIYCWDGKSFCELVELRSSSTPFAKDIVGRQVVARGFDIYCVGGEYGLGTGRFELDIWRYSTISKTWYYVTSLLEPRRHMAVEFMNEKLFLIGGVGRHRLKLSTVHVYDIRIGEWSKVADVPETFTSVPLVYSYGGALYLYKSHLYLYIVAKDCWIRDIEEEFFPSFHHFPNLIQYMMMYRGTRYVIDSDGSDRRRISSVKVLDEAVIHRLGNSVTQFKNQTSFWSYLIGFSCEDETISVEVMKITDNESIVPILIHKEKFPDVHDLCCEAPVGCFSIFKVNSLINNNEFKLPYRITATIT